MNRVKRRPIRIPASGSAWAAALVIIAGLPVLAHATEGGVGRPITGMQVTPYAGIVPPTSDWIVSFASIYYEGSLGASETVPIAGTISGGLTYHVSYNIANAVKTWGLTVNGWNFASSFGLPFQYTDVSSFNQLLPNDSATQFADIFWSAGSSRSATTAADSPI